jgi:hypothetical protein
VKTAAPPRRNESDPRLFDKTRATAYGRAAIREAKSHRTFKAFTTAKSAATYLESCARKSS